MTEQNELQQSIHPHSLGKCAWQGGGIALALMITFLLIVGDLDDGAWIFLPIFSVSAGGAFGGIFYYLMDHLRYQGGWKKTLANISCILVYILLLYFSLIAALSLTGRWN